MGPVPITCPTYTQPEKNGSKNSNPGESKGKNSPKDGEGFNCVILIEKRDNSHTEFLHWSSSKK